MAGDRIIEGLNDALAYAQGDTTRGKVVWPKGWQPISTAPNDQTVVLFYSPTGSPRYFMGRADDYWFNAYWLATTTHWQPLPAPPGDQG